MGPVHTDIKTGIHIYYSNSIRFSVNKLYRHIKIYHPELVLDWQKLEVAAWIIFRCQGATEQVMSFACVFVTSSHPHGSS